MPVDSLAVDNWSKRQVNDFPSQGNDVGGWDRIYNHPRILGWFNKLNGPLAARYGRVPSWGPTPNNGAQYDPRYPTLTSYQNPSSSHLQAPISNLVAPFRLGKPFTFGGQFTFTNGALHNEIGVNNSVDWEEDAVGGGAGRTTVAMPVLSYRSGHHVAAVLAQVLGDNSNGWVKVTYLDPSKGSDRYAFKIESEIQHRFWRDGTSRFPETIGIGGNPIGTSEMETYQTVHIGRRVLHEREFIIWDTGDNYSFGNPAYASGNTISMMSPMWFALVDCNYSSEGPWPMGASSYHTPHVLGVGAGGAGPTWAGTAGGGNRLALFASDTLLDLEENWWDAAKFTEGVNRWTFEFGFSEGPFTYSGFPEGLYGTYRTLGRCWGTDKPTNWIVNGAGNIGTGQTLSGPFPARYMVANLFKWPYYVGESYPVYGSGAEDYRYWMLLLVNRGNRTGQLSIGGPVILDAGWHPFTMPDRRYQDGVIDRSTFATNRWGDRFPRGRTGTKRVELQWGGPPGGWLDEIDAWLFKEALLRPRDPTNERWPQQHGLRTSRSSLAGNARPILYMDPIWDPSGLRTGFEGANALHKWATWGNAGLPEASQYHNGTAKTPPGSPPELAEAINYADSPKAGAWIQDADAAMGNKPENPGWDASIYARGAFLGYANVPYLEEDDYLRYKGRIAITEVPED